MTGQGIQPFFKCVLDFRFLEIVKAGKCAFRFFDIPHGIGNDISGFRFTDLKGIDPVLIAADKLYLFRFKLCRRII